MHSLDDAPEVGSLFYVPLHERSYPCMILQVRRQDDMLFAELEVVAADMQDFMATNKIAMLPSSFWAPLACRVPANGPVKLCLQPLTPREKQSMRRVPRMAKMQTRPQLESRSFDTQRNLTNFKVKLPHSSSWGLVVADYRHDPCMTDATDLLFSNMILVEFYKGETLTNFGVFWPRDIIDLEKPQAAWSPSPHPFNMLLASTVEAHLCKMGISTQVDYIERKAPPKLMGKRPMGAPSRRDSAPSRCAKKLMGPLAAVVGKSGIDKRRVHFAKKLVQSIRILGSQLGQEWYTRKDVQIARMQRRAEIEQDKLMSQHRQPSPDKVPSPIPPGSPSRKTFGDLSSSSSPRVQRINGALHCLQISQPT